MSLYQRLESENQRLRLQLRIAHVAMMTGVGVALATLVIAQVVL